MIIVGAIARRWTAWKWPNGIGCGFSPSYRRVRDALVPAPVRRWGGWWGWFVGHFGPAPDLTAREAALIGARLRGDVARRWNQARLRS